jgi:pSer/pThr/pTyr-binding forkhead associated (FHA) protein
MPFLTVLEGKNRGERFPLTERVVIGRDDRAEVKLDDAAISRRHARVYRSGDRYFVVDLRSSNGTQLNGETVQSHPLRVGDLIRVGESLLRFELDEAGSGSTSAGATRPARPLVQPRADSALSPRPETLTVTTPTPSRDPDKEVVEERGELLQFSPYKSSRKPSILGEDLVQRGPVFVVAAVVILAGVLAGLAWGIYKLTLLMMGAQ